jgi:hypothetical protein
VSADDARQFRLITQAALLEGARWAREHLYALLVLAPLVLGMTYFGVGRLVREAEWGLAPRQAIALAVLTAAALLVSSLSRAAAEVYHMRRPESLFDTLPIGHHTLLAAALARRAVRNAGVAAVLVVARALVGGGAWDAEAVAALALFVAVSSLGEVIAALGWVRWGRRRDWSHAAAGVVFAAAVAAVAGLLLLTVIKPASLEASARSGALIGGAFLTAVAAALAFALHARWRVGDIEYAKRLRARDRWGGWAERAARRAGGGAAVSAQVARDLRLTLRGFSSAVYAAGGVAALWLVALVAVLTTVALPRPLPAAVSSWAGATWLPGALASKAACVLACVSLACLVPALVAHQTPHLWLERVTGAAGHEVWRAKLYYARVVTLPAALAAWVVGALCGAAPVSYLLPLLGEHLWLWWIISALAGGLAYEMPEQPGLSLVLVACAGLAAGGFTAFLWPMGLALYAFGLPQLLMRGRHRAHLHLSGL